MNFKKPTCLFLAFLLLVSNIGFAFNVHYCGGKIASVSLDTTSPIAEKSCCAKAEKKASCCKDKVIQIEKKSDNATFKIFFFQLAFRVIITEFNPVVFLSVPNFRNNQIISYYYDANSPPLFQLYHQYIFYA
ncbi:HYC_CC_PP family protein [Flavobacterium piscis]|uniref:Uncharacterized protein n=1 Tax=Flavobacterium piscis TaxID=1114874 RepID=A0ABU1Y236_9FLAO|nr:hypothetical protein [Flavobacterium piscis]MDR7208277.1 hypothetical protein [Flavobacterium piscis]